MVRLAPRNGEGVVVEEVDFSAVAEVGLEKAGADKPLGGELGQVRQVGDAPTGDGPKATGEDIRTAGHLYFIFFGITSALFL